MIQKDLSDSEHWNFWDYMIFVYLAIYVGGMGSLVYWWWG